MIVNGQGARRIRRPHDRADIYTGTSDQTAAAVIARQIKIVIDDIDPSIFEEQVDRHARISLLKLGHNAMNVLGADAGGRMYAQKALNPPYLG